MAKALAGSQALAVWVSLGLGMCLGVAVGVLSVGYVNRALSSLGLPRSYDRDINSEAENLALFKFYCTPFNLGTEEPGGGSVGLQQPAAAHPPALSNGLREGGREAEGRDWRQITSPPPTPGWGPPCLHRAGPRAASPATPQIQGTGGNPSQPVLSQLRGQRVPIGEPPSCPAPRAISGGCLGALSCPVPEL